MKARFGGSDMPKGEHLKGVGEDEQKMYEHIVDEAKKDTATASAPKRSPRGR